MKRQRMLCAVLAAALLIASYPGGTVRAAWAGVVEEKRESEAGQAKTPVQMTEEELARYYSDSVLIGDSIMLGFRNYSAKKTTFVHGIQFLAAGSYSARNALKPVAGDNVHPIYQGQKYQVWDAVPLIGSKRVFILLGMNDIAPLGLEGARDAYKGVIDKIVEASPGIEIHVMSVTYTLKGKGKGKLNNDNIAQYNVLLQAMAEENGWGFVDLALPLSDGEGNLAAANCSDGFIHHSRTAYGVWEEELAKYAQAQYEKVQAGTGQNAEARSANQQK